MNKIIVIFICVLTMIPTTASRVEDDVIADRELIIKLTNDYILLLQKTINQRSGDYFGNMGDCFANYIVNDHTYDLGDKLDKVFVGAYLSDALKNQQIVEFDAFTEELEILPCVYFNPKTSKQYTYVKLPKIMVRKGNDKRSYSHYLSIDITESVYTIDAVYNDDAVTEQQFISPCMKEALNAEKQLQLTQTISKKYETVTHLYSQTNYLDALIVIEEILKLNAEHQESLDAKNAVLDLLNPERLDEKITNSIKNNNISDANTTILIAQVYQIGTQEDQYQWKKRIEQAEKKIKQTFDFEKAENFFKNEMYQQAIPIYIKLLGENYVSETLNTRITTCKEADPRFVQKKIKEAFNAAVNSKKNAPSTFKTYYKYETSGYLEGGNFRFMCQMMLSRGNKKLLKNMNISISQAKNLAIKYFFKAKELGTDMKDIQFMVFTQNFNKN